MPAMRSTGTRVAIRPDREGVSSFCADPTFLSPVCTWRTIRSTIGVPLARGMESMTYCLSRLDLVCERKERGGHVGR